MSRTLLGESLSFAYAKDPVFTDVTVTAREGTITGILGRNGCGKSTLLEILAGRRRPDRGSVHLDGLRPGASPDLAYLPQEPIRPRSLKMHALALAFGIPRHALASDPVLGGRMSCNVMDLSGGERRYLEILLALALNRTYLLLDEPFRGLAPVLVQAIAERLNQVRARGGVVLITGQNTEPTPALFDAVLWLDRSRAG